MPAHQLGDDPVGDIVDRVAVSPLGGDPRVEHHLQQHVAEFVAEGVLVTGLEGVQRLVRLLEQVRREGRMGLPGVPGALRAQLVHGRDQVDQPGAGQVSGAVQDLGTGRAAVVRAGRGQPHHRLLPGLGRAVLGDPVRDPRLVQGGQLGMTGRGEHDGRGPQGLPGRPAEQPGRYPRAGQQDGQQAGVSPADGVGFAGPGGAATRLGAETTWYWM